MSKSIWAAMLAAGLSTACVNIDVESRGKQYYFLQDKGSAQCGGQPAASALLIDVLIPSIFYTAPNMAFGKGGNSRGYYQYAQWTDRPANRMGLLVRDRLRQACLYRQVALTGEGLTGDYQLALRLTDLYHDASNDPGQSVVELDVQLIRRDSARLQAQKTFRATAPATSFDAKGASAGFDQAVTHLLDDVTTWLAQQPQK